MNKKSKILLFLLRINLGWLFFYSGITKLLNLEWTASGYLKNAKGFSNFYEWLALPQNIVWVDFLNEWGLTLIGVSLILGVFVRFSSVLGALIMFLYYLPILSFPYAGDHSYLVDEHIIYIFVLLLFTASKAGRYIGLDKILHKRFRYFS